jgi:aminoglycoside/choline kinase family phosphotransferase
MEQDQSARDMNSDIRLDQLTRWVRQFDGMENATPVPASEDASFRRYFRVEGRQSFIVMDAPPAQEDSKPFIRVAGYLESIGLNSPRVIEADLDKGFLLITDLGDLQYLQALDADASRAGDLYADAIDALLALQSGGKAFQHHLPSYDEALLGFEMSLFRDWLCETHLDLKFSPDDESRWNACCDVMTETALDQPRVFVHRDYHSRNLMVAAENNPGILDFQDAVEGPYTYDLVSLLKDCYIRWPAEFIVEQADRFMSGCEQGVSPEQFRRDFELMGVQRHLKASGIFARLFHRDGKAGYLKDVPRTLAYIVDVAQGYEELGFLSSLIAERVLPRLAEAGP